MRSRFIKAGTWGVYVGVGMLMLLVCPAVLRAADPAPGTAPGTGPIAKMMVQVESPKATCALVSDKHGILVVGHRGVKEHQLSVYAIGAGGKIDPAKVSRLVLPKPASLAAMSNYALGIAFHPTLPLLYVWQDLEGPAAKSNEEKATYGEFPHLVILKVDKGALAVEQMFANGYEYAYGQSFGDIAIEPHGTRVFLPNLRDPSSGAASIGYLDLDEAGLPVKTPVAIPGSLDGFGLNKFELQVQAKRLAVNEFRHLPTGLGFVTTRKRSVAFTGASGPAVWDTENRLAALGVFYIPGVNASNRIAADPDLPVIFGAASSGSVLYRVNHADGFPSMLPQVISVPGASFRSAPVLVPQTPGGAIAPGYVVTGGVHRVHGEAIDKQGRFIQGRETIGVVNPDVRAVVYSKKFRRLYVCVEKMQ